MQMRRSLLMTQKKQDENPNLIKVDELVNDTVWWNANILQGYTGWCTTPKIPVTPGETYTLQRNSKNESGNGQSYVSLFDSSQNYLRKENWTDDLFGGYTGQMASDVYYVGITIGMTFKDTAVFKKV